MIDLISLPNQTILTVVLTSNNEFKVINFFFTKSKFLIMFFF